jgi:hypothetical protein
VADLTAAQLRLLERVRAAGVLVFNGRARRTVKALESAGLVTADWDVHFAVKGNGVQPLWRITVRPTEGG